MTTTEMDNMIEYYGIRVRRTLGGDFLQITANREDAEKNLEAIRAATPELLAYINAKEAAGRERIEEEAARPTPGLPIHLTVEYAPSWGIFLQDAQYLTDEEKEGYADWYKRLAMRPVNRNRRKLDFLKLDDFWEIIKKEQRAGMFAGTSNYVYIITREQWDALEARDAQRKAEKEAKDRAEQIDHLRTEKKRAELQMRDGKLPDAEEARREWIAYNNVYNEGGEGWTPHFYTQAEYDRICRSLEELEGD